MKAIYDVTNESTANNFHFEVREGSESDEFKYSVYAYDLQMENALEQPIFVRSFNTYEGVEFYLNRKGIDIQNVY